MATYDLVVVGTGFASTFFLVQWLHRARPGVRVLVLERGGRKDHGAWVASRHAERRRAARTFTNTDDEKPWEFSIGFGGTSNSWWGCTPRMQPSDFRTHTLYGVGRDWPLDYASLEPWYCEVEQRMGVAGSAEHVPWPMSRPYPLPAHTLQAPDEALQKAFPEHFAPQPSARASRATAGRQACCNNHVCGACPVDAKFTVENGLAAVYADPRVTVVLDATATAVEHTNGVATGVRYRQGEGEVVARGDLVALGTNALFNPWLLLRSGLDHGPVGRGLCEQRSRAVFVESKIDAYGGGTTITGACHLFADGPHRRRQAGAVAVTNNRPRLLARAGRWRREWMLRFIFEEHPDDQNFVEVDPDDPMKPRTHYSGPSAYLGRSSDRLGDWAEQLLQPVARGRPRVDGALAATESHILCTHRMGTDPSDSVVDPDLRHHRVRNLLVLGGGAFPTAPAANPTLTLSALAMRAADRLA